MKHLLHPPASEAPPPNIYAHWHTDELLMVASCAGMKMAIMASRSRDGTIMKKVLEWFGYRVVRGSSTRGGAGGLKGLIDAVRYDGWDASLAVDGPRGPIYKVKSGVIKLAQETGRPIIGGVGSSRSRFVFKKAWNRCYLPLPFSRCVVLYGEPIWVPREATAEELERIRQDLEQSLIALKGEAERYFSRSFEPTEVQRPSTETGV